MEDKFICNCGREMHFYGDTPLCDKCNNEIILDYYWIKKLKEEKI
jgi:hypothetical protein